MSLDGVRPPWFPRICRQPALPCPSKRFLITRASRPLIANCGPCVDSNVFSVMSFSSLDCSSTSPVIRAGTDISFPSNVSPSIVALLSPSTAYSSIDVVNWFAATVSAERLAAPSRIPSPVPSITL